MDSFDYLHIRCFLIFRGNRLLQSIELSDRSSYTFIQELLTGLTLTGKCCLCVWGFMCALSLLYLDHCWSSSLANIICQQLIQLGQQIFHFFIIFHYCLCWSMHMLTCWPHLGSFLQGQSPLAWCAIMQNSYHNTCCGHRLHGNVPNECWSHPRLMAPFTNHSVGPWGFLGH